MSLWFLYFSLVSVDLKEVDQVPSAGIFLSLSCLSHFLKCILILHFCAYRSHSHYVANTFHDCLFFLSTVNTFTLNSILMTLKLRFLVH